MSGNITLVAPAWSTCLTIAAGVQRTHDRAFAAGWIQAYGPDYEQTAYTPEHLVASGTTLTLAGMRFTIRDVGPGEAENNTVVLNHDLNALFTGDATVAHGITMWGRVGPDRRWPCWTRSRRTTAR